MVIVGGVRAASRAAYLKSLRGRGGEEELGVGAELNSTELDPSKVGIISVGIGGRDDAIDTAERS